MEVLALNKWLLSMKSHANVATTTEEPSYYSSHPETLITTSAPLQFTLGTGSQILAPVLESCLSCSRELIIVTCFWAKSHSQRDISSLLLSLSQKGISLERKINVRLCFSSISPLQKLFQTSSLNGKFYGPEEWKAMGLPDPKELKGLDMRVKSIFVRPFSVMHPKFILVDRRMAFMPSCNVSWEKWFEGCVEMEGPVVEKIFEFWTEFWGKHGNELPAITDALSEVNVRDSSPSDKNNLISQFSFPREATPVTTVLLPSPHHKNPRFRPFSKANPKPPPTPLNTFLLSILNGAERSSSIYIQTPNLTSPPFITAIDGALSRGVNVQITTSRRLMILEQLVTAGTITEYEIWKLRRRHRKTVTAHRKSATEDPEIARTKPGMLRIGYFKSREGRRDEPVKSHFKCVIVDERITVLGSGNMDRASWFTSQELGVAFFSRDFAGEVGRCVDEGLVGRVDYIC